MAALRPALFTPDNCHWGTVWLKADVRLTSTIEKLGELQFSLA